MERTDSKAGEKTRTAQLSAEEQDFFYRLPLVPLDPYTNLRYIADFVAAVENLKCPPGGLILDLGAGACWVSEWLVRLGFRTVSLDISYGTLEIGKKRFLDSHIHGSFVAGDIEALPFMANTFDGIICLATLHHVPDIQKALEELHRVLRNSGSVVLIEPGEGHSQAPASRVAMERFNILEQDILIDDIYKKGQEAGFKRFWVVPFISPEIQLDNESWHALLTLPYSPSRIWAWAKRLYYLFYSLLPLPKARPIKQGRWLRAHLLHRLIINTKTHPILVLRNEDRCLDSRVPGVLRADIQLISAPGKVSTGDDFCLRLRIKNTGDTLWLSQRNPYGGFVTLGGQLCDAQGRVLIRDFVRIDLPKDIAPCEEITLDFSIKVPGETGVYQLKIDMVDELVTWFEARGSNPLIIPFQVD